MINFHSPDLGTLVRAMTTLGCLVLVACGGGGGDGPTALNDTFGPGNPSACPRSQTADVWFSARLGCLSAGQRFLSNLGATGARADRAYLLGQQAHDLGFRNVLGPGVSRWIRYTVCVKNAPANLAPLSLASDLGTALGLNVLATGTSFLPPGISGSTFGYGGIVDTNTLEVPCRAETHALIVDHDSGRIVSVNPGALAVAEIFDR